MHVEDYMNETPACLLAMLTQTREDLWQAAASLPSPQWNAPGQPGILPLPWPGKRQPLSTGRQIWS